MAKDRMSWKNYEKQAYSKQEIQEPKVEKKTETLAPTGYNCVRLDDLGHHIFNARD